MIFVDVLFEYLVRTHEMHGYENKSLELLRKNASLLLLLSIISPSRMTRSVLTTYSHIR